MTGATKWGAYQFSALFFYSFVSYRPFLQEFPLSRNSFLIRTPFQPFIWSFILLLYWLEYLVHSADQYRTAWISHSMPGDIRRVWANPRYLQGSTATQSAINIPLPRTSCSFFPSSQFISKQQKNLQQKQLLSQKDPEPQLLQASTTSLQTNKHLKELSIFFISFFKPLFPPQQNVSPRCHQGSAELRCCLLRPRRSVLLGHEVLSFCFDQARPQHSSSPSELSSRPAWYRMHCHVKRKRD